MKTRITDLLCIRYPIIMGGMQWVGRAELAAGASNAGALGMVTARTQPTPEALRTEIARTRSLTDQPFGVNLTLSMMSAEVSYDGWVDAIIDSGIAVVETAGNNPRPVIERLKAQGIKVIHKCTSVRHALAAQRLGVDIVSIDSFEAAGHFGEDDVPGMVMIPAVTAALDIPVVASGGIADGRAMAAALVLGADGVNLGTRFMLTRESPIHLDIKQALLDASTLDTRLIKRTLRRTSRVFRNAVSEEVVSLERRPQGASYEELEDLLSGNRGLAALQSGKVHEGLVCASQVIGLIDDIPSCAELVERLVTQCRERLDATRAFMRTFPATI
ncbi:MAG: nitronate monooxygenase [Proteobacteria bacterium]|nr:nitronate monooxygenase [Pseudomonadota bacterium]